MQLISTNRTSRRPVVGSLEERALVQSIESQKRAEREVKPPRGRRGAAAWPLCSRRGAAAWPPCGRRRVGRREAADISLPFTWPLHGRSHGHYMAVTWPLHGRYMAAWEGGRQPTSVYRSHETAHMKPRGKAGGSRHQSTVRPAQVVERRRREVEEKRREEERRKREEAEAEEAEKEAFRQAFLKRQEEERAARQKKKQDEERARKVADKFLAPKDGAKKGGLAGLVRAATAAKDAAKGAAKEAAKEAASSATQRSGGTDRSSVGSPLGGRATAG